MLLLSVSGVDVLLQMSDLIRLEAFIFSLKKMDEVGKYSPDDLFFSVTTISPNCRRLRGRRARTSAGRGSVQTAVG